MSEVRVSLPSPSTSMSEARPAGGSSGWAALLDAMEAGLAEIPPVVVESLPSDPGPVPPGLQDRAVRLLRRMTEVEAELAGQQAEVARELIGLAAARTASGSTAAPNVPRFLDTRA